MEQMRRVPGGSLPMHQKMRIGGLVLMLVLVLSIISTSFYTVEPGEEGVVTRFGKYERTTFSGLHFMMPLGIERVEKVDKQSVRKAEFGFRTLRAGVQTRYSTADYGQESLMLTGDLNQADVEWTVQYSIKDSKDFLFNIREPEDTLRAISESAMRAVIGDRSVTEVLTIGKTEIEEKSRTILQTIMDEYKSGIHIFFVKLQDVFPPEQVKPAFTDVEAAKQESRETVLKAQQAYNKVIPAAQGQAKQTVSEAEGYKIDRVNRAKGEAERFSKILAEYQKAPEVTRQRMYLETLNDVLPNTKSMIIVDHSVEGILPHLDLNVETEGSK